jgi:flagellar biosynthetic protein FliQ
VSVFQAATSINEQTLSFLPRLLTTLLALMFLGHWLVQTMMDFFMEMVQRIPQVVG